MASGGALALMWSGKMKKWRPPDEDLPGTAQTLVLLICGVGMVLQWYFARPTTIGWLLGAVAALTVACVGSFLRYNGLLGVHVYTKEMITDGKQKRYIRILGGRELLPEAKKKCNELGFDI
jgi:hypothetical protein